MQRPCSKYVILLDGYAVKLKEKTMKQIRTISLFLALLLVGSSVLFTACSNEPDTEDASDSVPTEESMTDEPSTDNSGDEGKVDEGNKDGEDETPEKPTDPADIVDPNAPENEDLAIIKDGASDYVIVYETGNETYKTEAELLSAHISEQFGVDILVLSEDTVTSNYKKKIIIGDADENAVYVKNKLYETNDFAIDVCGDDLVLYAVNEYVCEYLFEIAKSKFFTKGESDELNIPKDGGFIYHKSQNASYNYAQYLRQRKGSIDLAGLLELFEAREFTASDGTKIPYRLYIPSNYDPKEGTTPFMLFLHGAGERGNDNQKQLKNFMPYAFSQNKSSYANAVIICPQCPTGQQWVDTPWASGNYSISTVAESNELAAVVELISKIGEEFPTDVNLRYAVGLSMGGFGTWDLIMRHTELFAAAMPLCGGADPTQVEKLKDMPIWTFHGTADPTVPYAGTEAMAEAFEAIDAKNFRFFSMPDYKHNIWDEVSKNSAYGRWLFEQTKKTD